MHGNSDIRIIFYICSVTSQICAQMEILFHKAFAEQWLSNSKNGLRDTITPIVSFSYGMQSKKRIQDGIKYGVGYTLVIMAAGTIALELFAGPLCAAFGLSGTTESLCISAIRIISIGFIFAGISIALQGIFQALNCGFSSLIISICRQLLLILPVAWIFTRLITSDLGNGWIVWLTFPIAEIITGVIGVGLMYKAYKNRIKSL